MLKYRSRILPSHVYEGTFAFISDIRRKEVAIEVVMGEFNLPAPAWLSIEDMPRIKWAVRNRIAQEYRKAGLA